MKKDVIQVCLHVKKYFTVMSYLQEGNKMRLINF